MTRRIDRVWLLGGVVSVLLLAVAAWLLVIHPRYVDAAAVRDQIRDQNVQLNRLRLQLAGLDAQRKQRPALVAELNAYRAALPSANDMTEFVRQLQASSIAVNVDVSTITLGTPAKSAKSAAVMEVPISLSVAGTADNVSRFLVQLQSVQARAVLISAVSLSVGTDASGAATPDVTAGLTLTAFQSATSASTPTTK